MSAWPPEHEFPRCGWLAHQVGRFLLWAFGWRRIGSPPARTPKAVLIAAPHTSNHDFVWALAAAWASGMTIQWLGKDALFRGSLGPLLRWLGGRPVDRSQPHGLVGEVADQFRKADRMLLMVPAEGTRGYRDYWKSGFYHMAREAGVPVVMGILDYGKKEIGFGPVLEPSGDLSKDMDAVRAVYEGRTGKYPGQFSRIRLRQEDEAGDPERPR